MVLPGQDQVTVDRFSRQPKIEIKASKAQNPKHTGYPIGCLNSRQLVDKAKIVAIA